MALTAPATPRRSRERVVVGGVPRYRLPAQGYRYQVITPSGKPTATHLSRTTFRIGDDLTGADWTLPTTPFGVNFRVPGNSPGNLPFPYHGPVSTLRGMCATNRLSALRAHSRSSGAPQFIRGLPKAKCGITSCFRLSLTSSRRRPVVAWRIPPWLV